MKYKCAIFDLDGTLLDSLQGILNAVNKTFEELNFNVHRTIEEAKYYIGAGAVVFAKRAMKGSSIPIEQEPVVMERFLINYKKSQAVATKTYPGISEMIKSLQNAGYFVCLASNKPQILLDPIVAQLFPDIKFDYALGQRPNKPEKPDPFVIFEIINGLKIKPEDCVYIGDSEYDYLTAKNAGIDCIICKYGYGFYDKPWFNRVKSSVNTVAELEKKLLN